ncbi:MAG: PDZ domain-containing protein [Xanthomonadales bacterium]|nr:PDZ domain-containing protein [Xanthomonadales bacterium]
MNTTNMIKTNNIQRLTIANNWLLKNALILVLLAFSLSAHAGEQRDSPDPNSTNALRESLRELISSAKDAVFPSLVNIQVMTSRFYQGREIKGQSVGSGTIISKDGLVLTNYHVVRNGRKFIATLANQVEVTAELIGEDPLTDLALLRLNLDEIKAANISLSVAKLGNSDKLAVGDTVMSMGSPWALSKSVTLGIVSNTNRIFVSAGNDAEGMRFSHDQRTGIYTRWIQHDSAISPGNSGGPLVSLWGEVIGVNTRGSSNMGFAIPSNLASEVAAKLSEHGHVPRSWFGWTLKPIRNTGIEKGVLVNSIVENGPAAKSGIMAGDVILEINNEAVMVWFAEEKPLLLMTISDYPIGSEINLRYLRDNKVHKTTLKTRELLAEQGKKTYFREWGLVGTNITRKMFQSRRLESQRGVLVQGVRGGGPAETAEPSLRTGDVITAVNGNKVVSLAELTSAYETLVGNISVEDHVLLEFTRLGRSNMTMLNMRNGEVNQHTPEVAKAWLGISVQPVLTDLAKRLGSPSATGFRITRVYPATSAAMSELAEGDIVLSLNGERVIPRGRQDSGMLHRLIRRLDIGAEAVLLVSREGKEQEVSVTLERTHLTRAEVGRQQNDDFGLLVREITFFDRDENRWQADTNGVLVEKIERAGWGQLSGIRYNDLILKIDGNEINNLADYKAELETVTQSKSERVTFLVLRGAETRFLYIEPDWFPES